MSARHAVRTAALAALLLVACGHATEVPLPPLDSMETEVAEAIRAEHDAVLREPRSGKAWGRLADRYFLHELNTLAAECYAHAEEYDPDEVVWAYRQGLCRMAEQPELAVGPLERALRTLDAYAPVHEAYASVLVRLGRVQEAAAHYERARDLDRSRPQSEAGLGALCLARGELDQARAHYEEALARDPAYVQAHIALAQIYQALGQEKRAANHAELSRRLPPPSLDYDSLATPALPPLGAHARTRYARDLAQQGNAAEAETQYRAALVCDPRYYAATKGLSTLLAAQNRQAEALEVLRAAQRANPGLEQVKKDLARLQAGGADDEDP